MPQAIQERLLRTYRSDAPPIEEDFRISMDGQLESRKSLLNPTSYLSFHEIYLRYLRVCDLKMGRLNIKVEPSRLGVGRITGAF